MEELKYNLPLTKVYLGGFNERKKNENENEFKQELNSELKELLS